ncbi:hypothetical protein [Aquisphaera insulae]|uniref:hypothetical protein n=1 Tax=Aquisphaera insulae TaxID=2712864 RepID=UPI0013EA5611|nr:hypothetical protein [Aquisphaera insulae]
MAKLTKEQFLATFGESRHRVDGEGPPFDFWPYFDAIPIADFEGHDCSAGIVDNVWRMSPGPYEHVLVNSEDRNVFMVLVLDGELRVVHGHRLMDLNREYGLDSSNQACAGLPCAIAGRGRTSWPIRVARPAADRWSERAGQGS